MNVNDLVLCTVKSIVGTTVFVHIEGNGEGTIVVSEIAPGRIRNLRDYVVPNKKIVCKIIRIDDKGNINLSLRRVSNKEREEVLERIEKEKEFSSIVKAVLKDKAPEILDKIKKDNSPLYTFVELCKESPSNLKKYFSNEQADNICKILSAKSEKKIEIKKEFSLSSLSSNGIISIKNILSPYSNITYLAAGRYLIKISSDNYKKANQEMNKIISDIENKADKAKMNFEVKEK